MSGRAFANDAQRANVETAPNATRGRTHAPSLRSALGNRALLRMTALRRSCECGGSSEACACDVEKNVRAGLATPSHSMEPALQRQMESHFGHDFSGVRIHQGDAAAKSAHNVQAAAYTVGNHIVFGHNAYSRDVLAHELTHVVQQGGDTTIPTRLGDPHDALEHEAEAASANASKDP